MSDFVKVKPSYYNEFIESKESLTVYNARTGRMIKSRNEASRKQMEILKKQDRILLPKDQKVLSTLYQQEFLIDADRDELIELEQIEKEAVFDHYLNLVILPTEQCNFRCTYCYEKFKKGKMSFETQHLLTAFVEEQMDRYIYDGLIVSWFGGEPLLALDVMENLTNEFLKICKTRKKTYFAGVTTNGYYLTLDVFKKLKKLHVTEYQITIDGLPEDHDRQRVLCNGEKTADKIIDNLIKIKENIHSSTIRFVLRTNFTRPMLERATEFSNYLQKTFGSDKRFGIFWQVAEDYGYLTDESIRKDFCTETEYIKLIKEHAFHFKNSVFESTIRPSGTICYALKKNAFVIGSDGIIKKCTCDLDAKENNFGTLDGIIDEKKHELWLQREIKKDSECYQCKKRPICHFRPCKKVFWCPPNLLFYSEILKKLSEDNSFYQLV